MAIHICSIHFNFSNFKPKPQLLVDKKISLLFPLFLLYYHKWFNKCIYYNRMMKTSFLLYEKKMYNKYHPKKCMMNNKSSFLRWSNTDSNTLNNFYLNHLFSSLFMYNFHISSNLTYLTSFCNIWENPFHPCV